MKRLVILTLLAVLLTGCVKQEDYDALYKENAKLEKKIERLESDNDVLLKENEELKQALSDTPVKTTEETTNKPDISTNSDTTDMFEIYNNTFTNPESGGSISVIIEHMNGGLHIVSSYEMPPNSYFEDNFEAEAASALYSSFIITMINNSAFCTAYSKTDEYYGTMIFSDDEKVDGVNFFAFSRKSAPCYSPEECDWYSEFISDMDNPHYISSENEWIMDCFNTVSQALITFSEEAKEKK